MAKIEKKHNTANPLPFSSSVLNTEKNTPNEMFINKIVRCSTFRLPCINNFIIPLVKIFLSNKN